MYIPEGYGSVFPYMLVDGAQAFSEFLQRAFDAVEIGRTELPNGRIANLRIRIGTSTFMVSEADQGMRAMSATYCVYVENADRSFAKAIAAGAAKIFDPADMPYEDRQAGVTDPFGNMWWISQRLVAHSYD